VAGEREVYCGACGRPLPGRAAKQSDVAPPGWLVAPTAHDQAGPWFEPMPAVALALADSGAAPVVSAPALQPGPRVEGSPRVAMATPPLPLPLRAAPEGAGISGAGGAAAAGAAVGAPLRVLLVPLLSVALLSSVAAVALLVLHLLRDR
jgi:hypothetical protein